MKTVFSLIIFFISVATYGQKLNIAVDSNQSTSFDSKTYLSSQYKDSIKDAFIILNAVFNSSEFKEKLRDLTFPCENRCCVKCRNNNNPVTTNEIMDSLYKELEVKMAIHLKESCHNKLGSTGYHEYTTIACLENIRTDMRELPISYAIAVNLCHEYLHQVGFSHSHFKVKDINEDTPNPDGYKNDIAYRLGWDAYRIVKNWYVNKVRIDGLDQIK